MVFNLLTFTSFYKTDCLTHSSGTLALTLTIERGVATTTVKTFILEILPEGDRSIKIKIRITISVQIILYLIKYINLAILEWTGISLMLAFLLHATTAATDDTSCRPTSSWVWCNW